MIVVGDWLASREPSPPPELSARLAEVVGTTVCADAAELPDVLAVASQRLLAGLCDDRSAALDLLAADALITYALEAAADNRADVEGAAGRVIAAISAAASRGGKA